MRKINMITVVGMMITFLLHAIFGSFQLIGIGKNSMKIVAWILVFFIAVHTIIGIILTTSTLYSIKKSGKGYFKENKLFWLRRISGFLIIILMIFHLVIFRQKESSPRLQEFNTFSLITQILLVISILIHVISNIKPTLISFGITSLKRFSIDILIALSIFLLFFIIAFIIYYFRWQGM